MIFCVTSLIAAAPGCDRMDNGPEEPLESSSSALEQAAPLAGIAGQVAALVPGSPLYRQQLTALLGIPISAKVGEPCEPLGSICDDPGYSPQTACGGFTGTCDSSGSWSVLPVTFSCKASLGGSVCTAIIGQTPELRTCIVPSDGRVCSTGCGGSFCSAYPAQCAEQTTRVRNCFFNGVCSSDTCANQTVTQEVVGTCERLTEGLRCSPINGCRRPAIGICSGSVCACLLDDP
jgi:hypothetical protein